MYPFPQPPSLLKQGRGLKVGREIKKAPPPEGGGAFYYICTHNHGPSLDNHMY